jgi:hypothetical protein
LSQKDPKRAGSRDISELKARLGLKKGGAAAGPAGGAKQNGAGVVPPPGLNLPPPPGAKPPGPVIPSAADDPFGAMNAMAQYGAAQRAPEIVIVNDGKPVESVSTGESAAKFGKLAAIAIAPLILGIVIGQIAKDNKSYNAGLAGAKGIYTDVGRVRKELGQIKGAFENSGNPNDKKVAAEITKALSDSKEDLASKKELVFAAKQNTLNAELAAQIISYYSLVQEITDLIDDHLATAAYEEKAIAATADQVAKFSVKDGTALAQGGVPYKVGVVLQNPSEEELAKGEEQAAQLVEIGAVLCGAELAQSDSGNCANGDVAGFLYRYGEGGLWRKGKLHVPGSLGAGEKYPNGALIVLKPNGTMDALVKTAPVAVAESAYRKRLEKIYEKVKTAFERGEALETLLKKKSNEGKRFTFFL